MTATQPLFKTDIYNSQKRTGIINILDELYERDYYTIDDPENYPLEETRYFLYNIDQHKAGPVYPPGFTP